MKGYAMLKIGESGWIEKERPKCGPMDAICRPLAVAICTSDVHTLWELLLRLKKSGSENIELVADARALTIEE